MHQHGVCTSQRPGCLYVGVSAHIRQLYRTSPLNLYLS